MSELSAEDVARHLRNLARNKAEAKTAAHTRRRRDLYAQVPLCWAERVTNIRGASAKTLFVGIWLLHLSWKARSLTFSVPNGQLGARGVSRKAKYRALQQLEAAGLITVERRNRKPPLVTLVL
jgi:hypothetical protein